MAAPKRSKFQREKDHEQITKWYLQGWTQAKIAEELGLARSQIAYDLKKIQQQWIKNTTIELDEHKGKELAKIDLVEAEAWEAWIKSKEKYKQESAIARGIHRELDEAKNKKEVATSIDKSTKTEDQYGNPKYLELVMKCIERRCKMLGIDAPQKHEHTGNNGEPIEINKNIDLSHLTFDELLKLKELKEKTANANPSTESSNI